MCTASSPEPVAPNHLDLALSSPHPEMARKLISSKHAKGFCLIIIRPLRGWSVLLRSNVTEIRQYGNRYRLAGSSTGFTLLADLFQQGFVGCQLLCTGLDHTQACTGSCRLPGLQSPFRRLLGLRAETQHRLSSRHYQVDVGQNLGIQQRPVVGACRIIDIIALAQGIQTVLLSRVQFPGPSPACRSRYSSCQYR